MSINYEYELKNKYVSYDELEVKDNKVIHRDDIEILAQQDKEDPKTIRINLEKLFPEFDKDEFSDAEKLLKLRIDMRAYANDFDSILHDLNYMLNEFPDLALFLVMMNQKIYKSIDIDNPIPYDRKTFLDDIKEFFGNKIIASIVYKVIESTYTISLDDRAKENERNIVQDLQITDKTNKMLLESALLHRTMIPILCQYLAIAQKLSNKEKGKEIIYIFSQMFDMNHRSDEVDIQNKIFKIVQPRVGNTEYRHRTMWEFLKSETKDTTVITNAIIDSLIISIIGRLYPNKSSISLLDVVVKNKIEYEFKFNYKIDKSPLSISTDTDGLDEREILAMMTNFNYNEYTDEINRLSIKFFIDNYFKENNLDLKDIELFANNVAGFNEFQRQFAEVYFHDKFKIPSFKQPEAVVLVYIMGKQLEKNNYRHISNIIMSRKVADSPKKMSNRKPGKMVTGSRDFIDLLNEYRDVIPLIRDKNIIFDWIPISTLYEFEHYKKGIIKMADKNEFAIELANFMTNI